MAGPPPRSTFPSAPGEPSSRRLGVGSGGGGDRPLRAQIVVALVAVSILIAVPLYLLRRPSGKPSAAADGGAALDAGKLAAAASAVPAVASAAAADKPPELVTLSPPQRVRCGMTPNARRDTPCDPLPYFEDALAKAIRAQAECAPKVKEEGSVNYVLNIDFRKKSLHLFPGASGKWRGRQARRATKCVRSALAAPDWAGLQHRFSYYTIAVLATYPAPDARPRNPTATPNFE